MILPEGFSGSSIFYLLSFGYQLWEHGLVGRREAGREGRFAVWFFLSGGQRFLGEQKESFFFRVSRSVALK